MTKVKVFTGSCGFFALVVANRLDETTVTVDIESCCEIVKTYSNALGPINWKTVYSKNMDSEIFTAAHEHIAHNDCPIPVAVVQAILVEMGAAQARDTIITFEKEVIQGPFVR